MKVFRFESIRILKKNNLLILFFLLAVSLYFVNQGIVLFEKTKSDNELSLKYEKLKFKSFVNWDQYGVVGFRMFFEPSPLIVFFSDNVAFTGLESKIDTTEVININIPGKGKNLFSKVNSLDFAGIVFILYSLFMIFMGLENFPREKLVNFVLSSKYFILSIFSRLLLISGIFILMFSACFAYASFNGLSFSSSEVYIFVKFCFISILYLILFYFIGVIISLSFMHKKQVLIMMAFWLFVVFLIPELEKAYLTSKSSQISSPDELNLEKFSTLMDYERSVRNKVLQKIKNGGTKDDIKHIYKENVLKYLNQGYALNQQREKDYNKEVAKIVIDSEKFKSILPFIYISQIASEASSKGYHSYLNFFNHILKTRDSFVSFYIKNRYESYEKELIPFIRGEQNIFKAVSRLPNNFWIGFGMTCIYSLVLFGLCLWMFQKRKKADYHLAKNFPAEAASKVGTAFHVQCRDEETRNRVYHHLTRQAKVIGLNDLRPTDLDIELPPPAIAPYFCHIFGVSNIQKVEEYINKLDVEDYKYFRHKKRADLNEEDILKIYCSVILAKAEDRETIVLNETLYKKSPEFERKLLDILDELLLQKKRIYYLSMRNFYTQEFAIIDAMQSDEEYEFANLDLKYVLLR